MTSGREYIAAVLERLSSDEQKAQTSYTGAFLTAALSVIEEVESPLKEEALVRLAVLELKSRSKDLLCGRRAA